ncbi:hypothetical protein E8A20_16155 [Salmonella enterica]|nr:hypothetical protein [Salmonella enterica]EDR4482241.1 hypothetical protein [Salmonella enterica subsp. enterica]EDT5420902.1 hypothetical protein [Salmonella enterica subsp. enterica serovar Lille]EDW4400919.1 hypothetical protein [Salmonella enterica subsp. enterica serovar Braenderup]EED9870540.1 hypothetical protein [Salmonella enterica subsp. enterica serovar Cerro]EGI5759056.1 hypothetical protein [Salmonella enterica subsp. enterica serovar Alachua]
MKNRIPTLEDVQRRGGFLLDAGTIKGREISVKSPSIARDVNVSTSSVPGWLIRRVKEMESPEKSINKLLRSIDREFYDIKREVLADKRFTYQEKNQLLSVMHFERLKRKDSIVNKKEGFSMGSKDIRQMMSNNRKNLSGFTISAPEPEKEQPAESRFSRVMDKLRNPVNYSKVADDSRKSVEQHLDASNLYTKRTRKGHVHYLDKTSDKTLFVDNGQLITMRKNGLSKDSVAVALELAQGRFGSTLNIKGSKKFKEMVINVVAERGMDIHFTDKRMNEALQLRSQELKQAREQRDSDSRDTAFTIEGAELETGRKSATSEDLKDKAENTVPDVKSENYPLYRSVSTLQGKIVKHGEAPYLDKEGNSTSYYVTLKGKDGQETTQWGVGLKDALKGFRRGHEVSLELKESRPVQVRVRDENGHFSTREAVRNVWEATRIDGPQPKKSVETSKKDLMKGFQVVNSDDPTPDFS